MSELRTPNAQFPLVVIIGPTASGKTALAIDLAKKFNGEIICADSRTVYSGMDIGTAKPTAAEQSSVPHWGLDLVAPGDRYTAAEFKQYANDKIAEIRARGHVPLIVGGTGLYVDGIIFDYQFGGGYDPVLRQQLNDLTIEALQEYCVKNNIVLPTNDRNGRHLIRVIEQKSINTKRQEGLIARTVVVGIATSNDLLRSRIRARSEQMLTNGVVEEAIKLGKKYGWKSQAMTGNIYPLVQSYLNDTMTRKDFIDKNTTLDWQLAKRQLTWFRRNPHIYWGDAEHIGRYVAGVLEHRL